MDNQLQAKIDAVRQHPPDSLERRKALNRLLAIVPQLTGIYRSSHPDYLQALNLSYEWMCRHIDRFQARSPDIEKDFVRWFNGYLKWRIRDLYAPNSQYDERRVNLTPDANRGTDPLENVPDPKTSLGWLDAEIVRLQREQRQRRGLAVWQYVEEDPQSELANCHPRLAPSCNCQLLAVRLLLAQPPGKIADIAREFSVNNRTLYSHWKRKCLPLLQDIADRL